MFNITNCYKGDIMWYREVFKAVIANVTVFETDLAAVLL